MRGAYEEGNVADRAAEPGKMKSSCKGKKEISNDAMRPVSYENFSMVVLSLSSPLNNDDEIFPNDITRFVKRAIKAILLAHDQQPAEASCSKTHQKQILFR